MINEEIAEKSLSKKLSNSVEEIMDYLHKCRIVTDFQFKSDELLIDLANNFLKDKLILEIKGYKIKKV